MQFSFESVGILGGGAATPIPSCAPASQTEREAESAVIFIHIPKCGGTTLSRIVESEYDPLRIFSIHPVFFLWSYRRLMRWPAERLRRMQAFQGHMPFGIHRRLPQPASYFTFLRDPVERVVSAYYFARNYRLHPKHAQMCRLTLEQYVQTSPNHNVQCKLLSSRRFVGNYHGGDCDGDTLKSAQDNIASHFSLVGLTGRFDESLALLKIIFGWNVARYERSNVTKRRLQKSDLPPSTLELIAERNKYDLALYEEAIPVFNATRRKYEDEIQNELARLRKARAMSGRESRYYSIASRTRGAISRIHSAL
jgi:hypothetical protein